MGLQERQQIRSVNEEENPQVQENISLERLIKYQQAAFDGLLTELTQAKNKSRDAIERTVYRVAVRAAEILIPDSPASCLQLKHILALVDVAHDMGLTKRDAERVIGAAIRKGLRRPREFVIT